MSELKDYRIPTRSGNVCHCYFKSEADKVIAHQKYKRCLAMAECYEVEYKLARYLAYNSNKEIKAHKRWQKWLELAEKFKPNSISHNSAIRAK